MSVGQGGALDFFATALKTHYDIPRVETIGSAEYCYGKVSTQRLAAMNLAQIEARRIRCQRPSLAADRQDRMFLLVPTRGELMVEQNGRSAGLAPGCFTLIDSKLDGRLMVPEESVSFVMELPRSALNRFHVPADCVFSRRIAASENISLVLANILQTIFSGWMNASTDDAALVEDMVLQLLFQAIQKSLELGTGRYGILIEQMRDWTIHHIDRPDLSPEILAQQFHISRRTIYRLFDEIGTTPMKWLWDVRLDYARAQLSRGELSVSDTAYSAGFNDTSHFTRLFRRRFAELPKQVRRPTAYPKPKGR